MAPRPKKTKPSERPPAPAAPTAPETESQRLAHRLAAPFPEADIEWRVGQAGFAKGSGKPYLKVLAYVTNRAIQNRLDEVLGADGWRNEYHEVQMGETRGFLCTLWLRLPDGTWLGKTDGAELTDIESLKGGLSDSMKRAAVQWGIGRFLYDLEEGWAEISAEGRYRNFVGKGDAAQEVRWNPPPLPAWALPNGARERGVRRAEAASQAVQDAREARAKWLAEMDRLLTDPLVTDEDREAAADWKKENPSPPLEVLREKVNGIQKALAVRKRRAMVAEQQGKKGAGAALPASESRPTPAPAKNPPAATTPAPTEPAKATSGQEIPVSERATKAQRGLFLKMLQSHVFSDEERRIAKVACDDPMLSKDDLSGLIDNASKLSKRRKEVEKKAKEEAVERLKQGGYGD